MWWWRPRQTFSGGAGGNESSTDGRSANGLGDRPTRKYALAGHPRPLSRNGIRRVCARHQAAPAAHADAHFSPSEP